MLFNQVTRNSRHLLHVLLPPTHDTHYELRVRMHNFTLPISSYRLQHSVYEVTILSSERTNGKSEVVPADSELVVSVTCRRQKNVQQVP